MVWFWTDRLATVGTQTCGNLLSDIASGKTQCCQNSCNSVFTQNQSNQNIDTRMFDNMYLFNSPMGLSNSSLSNTFENMGLPEPGTGLNQANLLQTDLISGTSLYNPLLALLMLSSSQNMAANNLSSSVPTTNSSLRNSSLGQIESVQNLVSFAHHFVNRVNSDAEGNRIFSGGVNRPWCADFVSYCIKNTLAGKIPPDFYYSSVSDIRDWGIRNSCYIPTPACRTEENMKNYVVHNIHPGDIIIQRRNKTSHTGIVKNVAQDGSSYTVIEGNSSNKVQEVTYRATDDKLSGIVAISRFV